MKFKTAVIFFNAVVFLFTCFVFFVPFAVLGTETAFGFWGTGWIAVIVILLFLGGIDVYFFLNARVFGLLEKEDWPALIQELEKKVFKEGRYSSGRIRLLTNTYLVLSETKAITALEQKLAAEKPALLNANVLVFGVARLLARDTGGALAFFGARLPAGPLRGEENPPPDKSAVKDRAAGIPPEFRDWLPWYYGFTLLLDRRFTRAADCFSLLARTSASPAVTGLSAYMLDGVLGKFLPLRDLGEAVKDGKDRLRQKLKSRARWNGEIKKLGTEIYAAVLSSYLEKAGDYLYKDE